MDLVSVRRRKRKRTHLPGEIITDILLCLPFDLILNCKLVSTEWKNVINHPTFSINYKGFTNSMSLVNDGQRLLCLRIRHDKNKYLTKAGNPRFTVHQVPIAIDQSKSNSISYTHLSNGIACVLKGRFFYFYNLITGSPALHTVANSPLPHHRSFGWKHFGFGYDSYGDDYKIVLACHCEPLYPQPPRVTMSYPAYADKTQYWVYSFKNLGWKSFNDFPYSAYAPDYDGKHSSGTAVNGVLHWLVLRNGVMVTYDLHSGVFGEFGLPSVGVKQVGNEFNSGANFRIQEVGGKLCYTYNTRKSSDYTGAYLLDMWRMVGDDWEMLARINCKFAYVKNPKRPLMLHESVDGLMLILFEGPDPYTLLPILSWHDFVNNVAESFCEKVWQKQRIQNRRRAIVKRKTSRAVKN